MWREYVQRALHWIGLVIRQPQHELDRWQRAARFSYDLGRYGARQLREDRAPQMAAALAFQTLFALVPVLVVVMIIVQAFTNWQSFVGTVNNMLESAGLSDVTVTLATPDAQPQIVSLQSWLVGLIRQAADVDLTVAGWVGFVVIVYAGISMLTTVENSFNTIYRAPQGRSWSRRVPLYWFLITVSPLALTSEAWVHGHVVEWAAELIPAAWFTRGVGIAWSVCIGWLFWLAVYTLVPNTLVNLRSAAIGAFVCVLLLEIAKQSLGGYLSNAFTVSKFYGSLGLIPMFMFWVYLMWLFVLFGLEVAATLQFLGDRALEEIETRREFAGLVEPAAVITVMEVVAEDSRAGADPAAADQRPHRDSREDRAVHRPGTGDRRTDPPRGTGPDRPLPRAPARRSHRRPPDRHRLPPRRPQRRTGNLPLRSTAPRTTTRARRLRNTRIAVAGSIGNSHVAEVVRRQTSVSRFWKRLNSHEFSYGHSSDAPSA